MYARQLNSAFVRLLVKLNKNKTFLLIKLTKSEIKQPLRL